MRDILARIAHKYATVETTESVTLSMVHVNLDYAQLDGEKLAAAMVRTGRKIHLLLVFSLQVCTVDFFYKLKTAVINTIFYLITVT